MFRIFFSASLLLLGLGIWNLGLGSLTRAQTPKLDSLRTVLATARHDTTRITALNALGWELMYNNPDTAIILSTQALALAEALPSPFSRRGAGGAVKDRAIASSHRQLGVYNALKGNYPQALQHYFTALEINEKANDQNGIAACLGNIGSAYKDQGDYPKALDYYFRRLKMDEKSGNKSNMAINLGNIGSAYKDQGDYPKALDYYFRRLKMDEESGNKSNMAINLGGIGIVYYEQGDYPKALDYYFRALKIGEELGNKNSIAMQLGNIGIVYYEQGDYPKALDYYFRALKLAEEIGAKNLIAINLGNIGLVYSDQGQAHPHPNSSQREGLYNKALDYYFRALKMAQELGNKNHIAAWLGNIGSLYTATGKFAEAEKYLKQSLSLSDSIGALSYTMQF